MDADLEKLSVKLGWSDPRYSAQKGHSLFQDVEQGCIGGGGGGIRFVAFGGGSC